jgi:hypothetical protein
MILKVLGIVPILLSLQLRFNLSAYDAATQNVHSEFSSDPATAASGSVELDGMTRLPATTIKFKSVSSDVEAMGNSSKPENKWEEQ